MWLLLQTHCVILSHCPGYWWRSQTGSVPGLIPREHHKKRCLWTFGCLWTSFSPVLAVLLILFSTVLGYFLPVWLQEYQRSPYCIFTLSQSVQYRGQSQWTGMIFLVTFCPSCAGKLLPKGFTAFSSGIVCVTLHCLSLLEDGIIFVFS